MSSKNPGQGSNTLQRGLVRTLVLGVTAGAILAAPGQPVSVRLADTGAGFAAAGTVWHQDGEPPRHLKEVLVPGQPAAAPHQPPVDLPRIVSGIKIPRPGSIYRNPIYERDEVVVPNVARTAVLIGDSQSEPANGWPRQGLAALGYQVHFAGKGGTGFVKANGRVGNYIDALERGDWLLPTGTPGLVVVQGGGNDAGSGATDAQITANANRLLHALKSRYPSTRILMIGTLGRGAGNHGGRRSQVDALLATIAAKQGITFIGAGDWLTRYNLVHRLADTVHMNAEGHKALALVLQRRLLELNVPDLTATSGTAAARSGDDTTMD